MDIPTSYGEHTCSAPQVVWSKNHFRAVLARTHPMEPQVPRCLGISDLGDQTFGPQSAGNFWTWVMPSSSYGATVQWWSALGVGILTETKKASNCVPGYPWRQNTIWITLGVWNSVSRNPALTFSQNVLGLKWWFGEISFRLESWLSFLVWRKDRPTLTWTFWHGHLCKHKYNKPHLYKAQTRYSVGSVITSMYVMKIDRTWTNFKILS